MTLFKFIDFGERTYAHLRNTAGELVGTVAQGVIHNLHAAPDWRWAEVEFKKLEEEAAGGPESAAEPVTPAPAPEVTPVPAEVPAAVPSAVNPYTQPAPIH